MNYYEHHLGDYMRDTAHLSMLEDAAYRRLLDAYYIRERALPLDLRDCCKLVRAVSKPERDAVAYVLREFFQKADDGYHQKRADAEIGRFQDKQAKAKRSADARWNAHRSQSEGNANASPDAMRTHSEGNAPRARPQTPVTSNQTPEKEKTAAQAPFPVPDWINEKHWDVWHQCAKRRKASNAQKQMAVDKLAAWREQGQDYAGALENAAIGGNQGLFLPSGSSRKPINGQQALEDRNREVGRQWAEGIHAEH